jgi:hypothetical protein
MVRKSTRISNASIKSASKKRVNESSRSDFQDGDSSGSDFKVTKKGNKSKKVKLDSSASEEEDEEEEDSDSESRPPKVTIIPLPKAREAGDVPYEDGRIHENTMLFLKDLKANNNREWMRCIFDQRSRHFLPFCADKRHWQSTMKISEMRRKTLPLS